MTAIMALVEIGLHQGAQRFRYWLRPPLADEGDSHLGLDQHVSRQNPQDFAISVLLGGFS